MSGTVSYWCLFALFLVTQVLAVTALLSLLRGNPAKPLSHKKVILKAMQKRQKSSTRKFRIRSKSTFICKCFSYLCFEYCCDLETPEGVDKLAVVLVASSVAYLLQLWYAFGAKIEKGTLVWAPLQPMWYFTLGILTLALCFSLALLLSLYRLRNVFENSSFAITETRMNCYLWLIAFHAFVELCSLLTPMGPYRWSLWVFYDILLCAILASICYDFTGRLLQLAALQKPRRLTERSLQQTKKQMLVLQSTASKLTVLTACLCLASALWSTGPLIWLISRTLKRNGAVAELSLDSEVLLHLVIMTATVAFAYLPFARNERMYQLLCARTCHPLVLHCFVNASDKRLAAIQVEETCSAAIQCPPQVVELELTTSTKPPKPDDSIQFV